MIYITGDTHGDYDISKINTNNFEEQKSMTKNDYLIICGDFGGLWYGDRNIPEKYKILDETNAGKDAYLLNQYEKRNFTTLFVDGNYENHALLDAYPVEMWNGGKIHRIRDSIFHLMRGQVFTIEGLKFFTFGGAASTDKEWRVPGKSWWPGEMPDNSEYREAEANLKANDYTVDYVVTHCIGDNVMYQIGSNRSYDELTKFFNDIDEKLSYKNWFFGHYHADITIGKHIMLYNKVLKLT